MSMRNGGLVRAYTTDHLPRTDDGKSSQCDLVEVSIPGDQNLRVRGHGQSDKIVVLRVVRHHTWWVDGVIEQDGFVGEAVREAVRLLGGDVVLLRDPRMQQGLSDLIEELRADDELELTPLPQIKEFGCGLGGRQRPRDEAISIDDDAEGQDFLLCRSRPLTS
jgi:hypothetical protein